MCMIIREKEVFVNRQDFYFFKKKELSHEARKLRATAFSFEGLLTA